MLTENEENIQELCDLIIYCASLGCLSCIVYAIFLRSIQSFGISSILYLYCYAMFWVTDHVE